MAAVAPSRQLLRHLSRHRLEPFHRDVVRAIRVRRLHPPRSTSQARSSPPCHARLHPRARYITAESQSLPTSQTSLNSAAPSSPPSEPDITDHYTLFSGPLPQGPPPAGPFFIPLPTLRKEFLRLQALYHPDKAPPGTQRHKSNLGLSSLLNTAYRTLSDPLLRAQYLLQLQHGIDVTNEDNDAHPTDQSILIEVMEAQEAIEEASSEAEIERLKEQNRVRIDETLETMGSALEADQVEAAKTECVRLKYWRSLQDGLESWEPGKEVRLIH